MENVNCTTIVFRIPNRLVDRFSEEEKTQHDVTLSKVQKKPLQSSSIIFSFPPPHPFRKQLPNRFPTK